MGSMGSVNDPEDELLDSAAVQRLFTKLRTDLTRAIRCRGEDGHSWGPVFDGAMRCRVCGVEALTEPEAEEERGSLGF